MAKVVKVKASVRKGKIVKAHTRVEKRTKTKTSSGEEFSKKALSEVAKHVARYHKADERYENLLSDHDYNDEKPVVVKAEKIRDAHEVALYKAINKHARTTSRQNKLHEAAYAYHNKKYANY